ncbi:MAG: hypothetical protein ACOYOV_05255 [Bacteroidales bacterium]
MKQFIIFISIVALLFSCSAQKKVSLNFEDKSCNIKEFENHLLFKYKTNNFITRDKEKFKPISFEIQLPKKVKFWEVINSTNFGFYYKQNQVILITTTAIDKNGFNLDGIYISPENQIDSIYIPSKHSIEKMICDFETSGYKKWDIKKIRIIKNRKNLVVRKENITILLLNIEENCLEDYCHFTQFYTITQ